MASSSSTLEFNGAHKGWKAYHKKVLEEMVHMELKSKKKLHAGTLLTVVHRHLEADSEPLRIAEQIQDHFDDAGLFEQAAVGLYISPEFPAEVSKLIAVHKTALGLEAVAQIISDVLQESPVPALHKAAEAVYRTPLSPVDMQQIQDAGQELEDLQYKGGPVSPAMAVAHLFLAAFRALYGVAGHAEKQEFLRLAMQGSQGDRSIAQFGQHCTSKWAAIKVYLSEADRQLMFTFLKGLNDAELTAKGLDLVEKNPPGYPAITMLDMMNRLSAIEQMRAQHMQSQLQAATAGGVPTDELLQLLQQQQRLNKGQWEGRQQQQQCQQGTIR
jgi:hypothetical protein